MCVSSLREEASVWGVWVCVVVCGSPGSEFAGGDGDLIGSKSLDVLISQTLQGWGKMNGTAIGPVSGISGGSVGGEQCWDCNTQLQPSMGFQLQWTDHSVR